MIRKLNPLLACAAAILTLGVAPTTQAQRQIPEPEVTNTQFTDPASQPPFIFDSEGDGNAAFEGENISVETTPDEESTLYKFCFDYGQFSVVYDSSRTTLCDGFITNPLFDNSTDGVGNFLNLPDLNFAERALGDPNPDPPNDPTSDGLKTALIAGDSIIRAVGNYDEFPFFSPVGFDEVVIPYADANSVSGISGVFLRYDNGAWQDPLTGQPVDASGTPYLFVRLQRTGFVQLGIPIPESSSVFGVILVGVSFGLSGWRKVKLTRKTKQ
ncbi:MAG: hypothetical protein AB4041_16335 [Microcystaceae cyanobacterium]